MLNFNSTLNFLLSLGLFTADSPKIIGKTEFGKLEGTSSTGRDGRTIYEFVGIPFALPPVGDLRFRPPVEWNASWEGVRDATSYGSKCKQFHLIGKFITGDEDCLYLNVYTHTYEKEKNASSLEEKVPLNPVIIYFHGGLFMHGSGEFYKPKYFLDSDIVLVTVNYRLGALGFLNLGAEDINGNQGLKDQVAALKWVQRNIKYFGGDPNLVTIMGESAGGACVHYHLLSPLSKGLFHRAISQSGNALVSWASQDNPQDQALHLANRLGCIKPTRTKIARCLRNLDADKFAKSQRSASDLLHDRYALYAPTIEPPGEDSFISDLPQNIIRSGNFSKVPWLVGVNSEEGLIYSAPILKNETLRAELNTNWTSWAPTLFRFSDEVNAEEIAEQIRTFYLGNTSAEISMKTLHNTTTFLSDRSFFEGLHNSLILHRGQHHVWPYVYAYEGKFSFAKVLFGMTFTLPVAADVVVSRSWKWFQEKILRIEETSYGVAHGDELPLFFKLPFQAELKEKDRMQGDYNMSNILVTTWSTFAREGVPPPINNISWPLLDLPMLSSLENTNPTGAVGRGSDAWQIPIQFMKINRTCEVVDEPFHDRISFWRDLNLLPFKRNSSDSVFCNSMECASMENVNENDLEGE